MTRFGPDMQCSGGGRLGVVVIEGSTPVGEKGCDGLALRPWRHGFLSKESLYERLDTKGNSKHSIMPVY